MIQRNQDQVLFLGHQEKSPIRFFRKASGSVFGEYYLEGTQAISPPPKPLDLMASHHPIMGTTTFWEIFSPLKLTDSRQTPLKMLVKPSSESPNFHVVYFQVRCHVSFRENGGFQTSKFVANFSESQRTHFQHLKVYHFDGPIFHEEQLLYQLPPKKKKAMWFQPPRGPHNEYCQICQYTNPFVTISIFPPLLGCPVGR